MVKLSIIIPTRSGANCYCTLRHLGKQTFQGFEIVVSQDLDGNANAARQAGLPLTTPSTEFLLFSDDDIQWKPEALARMIAALEATPAASYAYGSYEMGGKLYCNQVFDAKILMQRNLVSTMSIVRRADFPGWDVTLQRLQDWELWRRLWLFFGKWGIHCNCVVFSTDLRNGITRGGSVTYEDAHRMIVEKHANRDFFNLPRSAGLHPGVL